jgi:XTP/dITP diphosphohydrolase
LQLLLATGNPDKLHEMRRMMPLRGVELVDLGRFPELGVPVEDGRTLEENALKKARWSARRARVVTLADDTGLEVDALSGRPGVLSARLAGTGATYEDNRRTLLAMLENVADDARGATFRCVVAVVDPDGWEATVEGACRGLILSERRGSGDFGYDPVFLHQATGKTFAEMTAEEKDEVSHRGRAIRLAADLIARRYGLDTTDGR